MRIREGAFQSVALASQQGAERFEIGVQHFDAARIECPQAIFSAQDVQRRSPLRARLCQEQRSVWKIKGREAEFRRDLRAGREPSKPAGDHQVDDDEKIIFERDDDSLSDAAYFTNSLSFQ